MEDQASLAFVPTAAIDASNLPKHPQMEEIFQLALDGRLPRSRELKSWEPERLNETHLQIIMLRAAGMRQTKIAKMLGVTDSNVSVVCNHPDAQYILARMVGYAADNVTDIRTRIAGYAPEALDVAIGIMRNSNDDKLRAKIGFDILDRAGYSSVQKVEGEVTHRVVADSKAVEGLSKALNEAGMDVEGEVPASYTMSGREMLMGEGSGNSLVGSESQEVSGPPVEGVPPTDTPPSPTQKPRLVRNPNPDIVEQDLDDAAEARQAKILTRQSA